MYKQESVFLNYIIYIYIYIYIYGGWLLFIVDYTIVHLFNVTVYVHRLCLATYLNNTTIYKYTSYDTIIFKYT